MNELEMYVLYKLEKEGLINSPEFSKVMNKVI